MQRFAPYLGIVAALILGAILVAFSGSVTVSYAPAPVVQTASSTIAVEPGFSIPTISLPALPPVTDTTAAVPPVPKKRVPVTPAPTAPAPSATAPVSAPTPPASSGNAGLDAAASTLRAALVNIICYAPAGGTLHSISGSGVFISSKGVILTNAHVAQYFLLADRGVSCTIRAGSPAADDYNAALIYIPSLWINTNASVLTQTAPSGTGEHDFALLAVTKSATSAALPSAFPFIALAEAPPSAGTPVVIASYGAQFLETAQVQSSLFPTIVFGSVKDVFTFGTNTIDVLALGGSAAAQEGSSGGGVADASGKLVGTITTSTVEGTTATRSLDAITASYIRSDYASDTGSALDLLLSKSTSSAIADFAPQMSGLESILTAHL